MMQATLIIMGVILTACVAFLGWLGQSMFGLARELSAMNRQIDVNTDRIKEIEQHGSPALQGITARLDGLQQGQTEMKQMVIEFIKIVSDGKKHD